MNQEPVDKTCYNVTFAFPEGTVHTLPFKVKHFRQYNGNRVSSNGGHTAIFDVGDGRIFSSKCRNDEQFSRRKGILTCLQKALNVAPLKGKQLVIADHEFTENGVTLFLVESTVKAAKTMSHYWLSNSPKRNQNAQ